MESVHQSLSLNISARLRSLDQLAAARSDFAKQGMLNGSVFQDFFQCHEFSTSPCGRLSNGFVAVAAASGSANEAAAMEANKDGDGQ